MAAISNSVVHLSMRLGKKELAIGTGFIYQHDSKYFIVTAWHNLTGRHPETLKCLSETLGVPDNVIANIAVNIPNSGSIRFSVVLPLMDEEKSLFFMHPVNWPRVDVAVIPFDPTTAECIGEICSSTGMETIKYPLIMSMADGAKLEICPIQKYLIQDAKIIEQWLKSVDVTEELFIPGYPRNIQDYYSQPIWKRATIASSVQHGWNREPKFLIDSASKSGMSGSPVLYYSPNGSVKIGGTTYQLNPEASILAGIYVGRLGVEEGKGVDPQVGIVWNQSVIDEIIQAECFEKLPVEIQLSNRELTESVLRVLASCSKQGLANVKNPEMPSRYYFCQRLMNEINGRVSPERALEAILNEAEAYDGPLVPDENE